MSLRTATVTLLLGLATAAPAAAMDLKAALEMARRSSPLLAMAEAGDAAAAARRRQAQAARGPTVTVSGMIADGHSDLDGFFGFGATDVTPSAAMVEARQPLFTSGALRAGLAGAAAGVAGAREGRRAAEAGLTVAVVTAFADVLTAERGLATARRQSELLAEIARQAEARFEAGEIARSDLAEATARRAEALAARAEAEARLEAARAAFARVVGAPADGLAPLPSAPDIGTDVAAALDDAVASSPGLAAAQFGLDSARAQLAAARAGFGPSVAVTARASQTRDEFLPGYRNDEWRVGVQGRWVLFDSGSTAAAVSEQAAGVRMAEARLRDARREVEAGVLAAFHGAHAARLRLAAAEAAHEASVISAASVADEVAADARPLVDRLDAEARVAAAERARAAAARDALVLACQLRALAGDASCGGLVD